MERIKQLYIKYKEVIRYLVVGGLTTVVSLGTYYLCVFTFLNPSIAIQLQTANVISWIAAVTFAYFTNRKFVFESKNSKVFREAVSFYLSRVGTLLVEMIFMWVFVTRLGLNDKLMKILVQILIIILNYIFSKFLVFRNKNNKGEKGVENEGDENE